MFANANRLMQTLGRADSCPHDPGRGNRLMQSRCTVLGAAALLPLASHAAADPIVVGVSGPLTGQYAQYGADWKRGFDLALAEVNKARAGSTAARCRPTSRTPNPIRARRSRSRSVSSAIPAW